MAFGKPKKEKILKTITAASADRSERQKSIDQALKEIRTKFGDESITTYGAGAPQKIPTISTGSIGLDAALGVGGLPRGRIIEIFGPESSGKTTLAQHIVAEVQKMGGIAAYIDAEHALDPEYARKIGVNVDDLFISQPDHGEQALEILETLVRSNAVDVVVIDSVAALTPKAEIEGDMGDAHMGLQARLMSQALRKLTSVVSKSNTIVVFVNQIRHKIGVFFGNPETTPGGNALKFYASVRIEVRRAAQIKQGEVIVGNRVKLKVVKNKVAPPFRACEFDIMYNEGISISGDLLDLGVSSGALEKNGNSYTFPGDGEPVKLGVGRENAKQFLKENPELVKTIREVVKEKIKENETAT